MRQNQDEEDGNHGDYSQPPTNRQNQGMQNPNQPEMEILIQNPEIQSQTVSILNAQPSKKRTYSEFLFQQDQLQPSDQQSLFLDELINKHDKKMLKNQTLEQNISRGLAISIAKAKKNKKWKKNPEDESGEDGREEEKRARDETSLSNQQLLDQFFAESNLQTGIQEVKNESGYINSSSQNVPNSNNPRNLASFLQPRLNAFNFSQPNPFFSLQSQQQQQQVPKNNDDQDDQSEKFISKIVQGSSLIENEKANEEHTGENFNLGPKRSRRLASRKNSQIQSDNKGGNEPHSDIDPLSQNPTSDNQKQNNRNFQSDEISASKDQQSKYAQYLNDSIGKDSKRKRTQTQKSKIQQLQGQFYQAVRYRGRVALGLPLNETQRKFVNENDQAASVSVRSNNIPELESNLNISDSEDEPTIESLQNFVSNPSQEQEHQNAYSNNQNGPSPLLRIRDDDDRENQHANPQPQPEPGAPLDNNDLRNQALMNKKKSRKQALREYHEKLSRENPVYQNAVLFDPKVKKYNKRQLKNMLRKKRKRIDFTTKQSIIRERFISMGSIQEKRNSPSFKQIGKLLKVNDRTVNSIVNRYKKLQGRLFPNPMDPGNKIFVEGIQMPRQKLGQVDLAYILDPQRIKEWAAYSLNKRCALIEKELGKKISRVTLAKYYKRGNVRYIKPEYTIYTDKKDQEIHLQRLQFVPQLLECYKQKIEVIYIDECTTNVWQKPNRIWIPKDNPFKIKLASQRGEGVTIIGAISSMRKCLIYYLCDGSSINHLEIFFMGLNKVIPLKDKVIVLDNLSAHRNEKLLQHLKQDLGANLLFLPVATSFFNPIETIWAWVKMQWKNRLLDPEFASAKPDMTFLTKSLAQICDSIPGPIVQNIAGHTFKIMREYMIKAGVFKSNQTENMQESNPSPDRDQI